MLISVVLPLLGDYRWLHHIKDALHLRPCILTSTILPLISRGWTVRYFFQKVETQEKNAGHTSTSTFVVEYFRSFKSAIRVISFPKASTTWSAITFIPRRVTLSSLPVEYISKTFAFCLLLKVFSLNKSFPSLLLGTSLMDSILSTLKKLKCSFFRKIGVEIVVSIIPIESKWTDNVGLTFFRISLIVSTKQWRRLVVDIFKRNLRVNIIRHCFVNCFCKKDCSGGLKNWNSDSFFLLLSLRVVLKTRNNFCTEALLAITITLSAKLIVRYSSLVVKKECPLFLILLLHPRHMTTSFPHSMSSTEKLAI